MIRKKKEICQKATATGGFVQRTPVAEVVAPLTSYHYIKTFSELQISFCHKIISRQFG
jgi:hypothetical protein